MTAADTETRPKGAQWPAPMVGEPACGCARLVAVIGPPAVGKSTATSRVAEQGARVWRLREFAQRYRINHPELDHLFATADPLGWLRDDVVRILLDAALGDLAVADVMLLENLPGNAAQLRHLVEVAATNGFRLQVVELAAPDSLLRCRVAARRVCPCCEPDPRGDPHRPAHGQSDTPEHCARCGSPLRVRRGDEPSLFRARLARFRGNHPGIRVAAHELAVPYRVIDATADPGTVAHMVLAACQLPVPTEV
jgi:adenylate kinase family enzyme